MHFLTQGSSATSQALVCRTARHLFVSGFRATGEFVARLAHDVVWQRRAHLAMAQHALALGDEPQAVALLEAVLDLPSGPLSARPTIIEAMEKCDE